MGIASSKNSIGQRDKTRGKGSLKDFQEKDEEEETTEKIKRRSINRINAASSNVAKMRSNESTAKMELKYIVDAYDKFANKLTISELRDYRNEVAQLILGTPMFDFIKSVVEKYSAEGLGQLKPDDKGEDSRLFLMCLSIFFHYSNYSDTFAAEVANTRILDACRKVLEICAKLHLDKRLPSIVEEIVFYCHGIAYHVSMRGENVDTLRRLDFIKVLKPYLKSHKDIVKIPCLATLANIVNEEECDVIRTNLRSVFRLLEVMTEGLDKEDRSFEGWSCKECALAIRNIAKNDANKQILLTLDVLPLLVEFAEKGEEDEQLECVLAIWTLAFDKDIRENITTNKELKVVELLLRLKNSANTNELKNACERCLWTLLEELKSSPIQEYKEVVKQIIVQPTSDVNEETEGHIMISYQSAHRDTLKKIRDILIEHKYKVWMDIDQMGGSTLQAMANAVENASIVLLCYSRNYKDSQYCQSEAEYAYNQRKQIIPLKMEQGYKPDGWLGILLGEKYFVEFSGKYDFNEKVKDLFKEIKGTLAAQSKLKSSTISMTHKTKQTFLTPRHDEMYLSSTLTSKSQTEANMMLKMQKIHLARTWTEDDVTNWLREHNLLNEGIDDITGEEISLLAIMQVDAPERMHKCIKRELELTSLRARSRLVWALFELSK